jgi:GT2 family glycosyltransferase
VVIPTLVAGETLAACVKSLSLQTQADFEIIVVDNSGKGLVRDAAFPGIRIIEMGRNAGFGAAINAGLAESRAPYLVTLNDDAAPRPGWLAALIAALDADPEAGLGASQVRIFEEDHLDSAGMLICADGSSKQRGHLHPPADFESPERVLMPSASAAIYRRAMLDDIGAFDPDFFLYCEDTDLGLRAARAGWRCLYVPGAKVEHRYSHSAGRASPLKAYFVERNRIFVAVKNFPLRFLLLMPFVTIARYWWHLQSIFRGRGTAAQFHREGHGSWRLAWFVCKAHLAALAHAGDLWAKRKKILRESRIPEAAVSQLLRQFSISAREVAEI